MKGKCLQIDLPAIFGGEDRIKKGKQGARFAKCFPLSFVCHLFQAFRLIIILVIKVEITCCFL